MKTEKSSNTYQFKRLTKTDYPKWATFFSLVFNKKIAPEFYHKKYNSQHLGKGVLACFAHDENDEMVAAYTNIPYEFIHNGQLHLGLQNCDDATHPQHQRKGLSTDIAKHCFELAKQENYTWIFGLPNETLSHVFRKLNWIFLENFKLYDIKIKTIPIFGICHRLGLTSFYGKYANFCLKNYKIPPVSFNSFDDSTYLIVHRSPEHLAYKAGLNNFFIKIGEVIFWIKLIGGSLVIGDLKASSEQELQFSMTKLKKLCAKLGLKSIVFQTQTGSNVQKYFAKTYDSKDSLPIFYMNFGTNLPLKKIKLTFADFDTF